MGQAKRILVIDDETALCDVLKARLESYGYSVTTANDGQKGWQEITASTPDLVFLDIRMPNEDGYTFLKKLRAYRDPEDAAREKAIRKLPVIVVTGTGDGMKPLFEQEQISAFITKPIDSTLMKKLVEDTLGR